MEKLQIANIQSGLSVDCVIFGFHGNELKILILKLKNLRKWALPGGFVRKNKDVDQEAHEVLKIRTGLDNIFLRQFFLFGNMDRNIKGHAAQLVKNNVIDEDLKDFFNQRFITVGYYALVEYSMVQKPTPDFISETCKWCSINEIPDMILDHRHIIEKAHETLKNELNNQPIGLNLLPKQFTMPEIQALYETVLEKKLDRRNFRRKMLKYNILITTDEKRKGVHHRAPLLYEFDLEKYHRANLAGLNSGW